jgi:hypothetical protein
MIRRAAQIASFVYLLGVALTVIDGATVHVWPDLAVKYFEWSKAQYRSLPISTFAYASLALTAGSVLGAAILACGVLRARHLLALSFGGLLVCNGITACLHIPPAIVTPYQNFLGDISTLAIGVALTASYILAAQPKTSSDGPRPPLS